MLGIYIHIPFCVKKCNYCDFTSVEAGSLIPGYLSALKREIELSAKLYPDGADSVFIGGGTPGRLDEGCIADIMDCLRSYFPLADGAEVTIETNPCVVTQGKLAEYRSCGINRISMGLQAVQPHLLELLGRLHTQEQFDEAFDMAREAGFQNINADVMYALSGQTMEEWEATLYHLLYKKPEHISAYALSLEAGTPLCDMYEAGEIARTDEDTDAEMYAFAQNLLSERGYLNYEISNFARDGRVCAHNLKYWELQNYLGLGAAAHSFVNGMRFENTKDIEKYIAQLKTGVRYESSKFIDKKEHLFEYIMLRLRLRNGIDFAAFKKEFGQDFEKRYAEGIEQAQRWGLAAVQDGRLCPTAKGFALQNKLAGIFL